MSLMDESQQLNVSEQRRLPVDNVGTDAISSITGETVQLYFYNSGVLTTDAGQAAGTIVVGKLKFRNIKNALGDVTATYQDTSLSFTSTALTNEVKFPNIKAEQNDKNTGVIKAEAITEGFANGDYCVDYRTGTIYGKKASTQVSLTSTSYKVEASTSGGGGIASDVNLSEVGGSSITLGQKTMANSIPIVLPSDQSIGGADVDDSAFTAGTDKGQVVMGFYDSTDDEVDDGDKGALKMTKKRRLEVRDEAYDSSVEANNVGVVNGPETKYDLGVQEDLTNVSAGTAYYPSSEGALTDGYKDISLQGEMADADGDITLTLWVSNHNDGSTAKFQQVKMYDDNAGALVSNVSCSSSTTLFAVSMPNLNYKRYYYKVVYSGSTNSLFMDERKKAL